MELRTYIKKIEDTGENHKHNFTLVIDRYRDKEVFNTLLDLYQNGEIVVININSKNSATKKVAKTNKD